MNRNLLSFFLMFATFSFSIAQIPQIEKQALYSIAASVQNEYNWNEQTPVEQWKGITISSVGGNDHVTGLQMSVLKNGSNYSVNFSSEISKLIFLQNLSIKNELPLEIKFTFDFSDLNGLNELVSLDLIRLRHNGNNDVLLNANDLGFLNKLENLHIDYFSAAFKIPTTISSLINLKKLYYKNRNDATSAVQVHQLASLEDLTLLTIGSNLFTGLYSLNNLTNLKSINFGGTFSSLPTNFYQIPHLEKLEITSSNYILQDEIGNYADRLKSFTLKEVSSVQQTVIGDLVNLEELSLQSANINLGSFLNNLIKLETLIVESENVILLAPEISQLTNLENLYYLSFAPTNDLIYTIPNLKYLVLYTNQNISDNIVNLTKLEHLQVNSRENFDQLPESVGNMITLKKIDFLAVGGTTKTLTIPSNYFLNWPNLEQFWTWHRLDGDITNRFINNQKLETLYFQTMGSDVSPMKGRLNLCQNPKIDFLNVLKTKIRELDLRTNESIANNLAKSFYLIQNNISKFVVDDVAQFNALVTSGKILIQQDPSNGYTVETSSEPCKVNLSENNIKLKKTMLYPNPVNDFLTFKTDKLVENVEVFSASGQKFQVTLYNNNVDLSSLAAGIYMIKWSEAGFYKLEKILKN